MGLRLLAVKTRKALFREVYSVIFLFLVVLDFNEFAAGGPVQQYIGCETPTQGYRHYNNSRSWELVSRRCCQDFYIFFERLVGREGGREGGGGEAVPYRINYYQVVKTLLL